tara:strand:- start:31 stop:933 length:903 start_codon:yes stop_codon:yes gene_type:complete
MNNDNSLFKTILFIAIILFISCAKTIVNDQGTTKYFFGTDASLDIVTWNIEYFPKNNKTIEYVSDIINSLGADIIGLQEITDTDSFIELIDSLDPGWVGFRSGNSAYGELSFLINSNEVDIVTEPYSILKSEEYYFAFREPLVIDINYRGDNYSIINVHYKCCGNGLIGSNENDEEYRREKASEYLADYISDHFEDEKLLVIGDFNDQITDSYNNNVFKVFINSPDDYYFADTNIENGGSESWSYPGWPSHLDHILINSKIFSSRYETETIKIESTLSGGWNEYDDYISDHRPVGIKIFD